MTKMLNWNYVFWGIVVLIVAIIISQSSVDVNFFSDDNTREISENFLNITQNIDMQQNKFQKYNITECMFNTESQEYWCNEND